MDVNEHSEEHLILQQEVTSLDKLLWHITHQTSARWVRKRMQILFCELETLSFDPETDLLQSAEQIKLRSPFDMSSFADDLQLTDFEISRYRA